MDSTAQPESVHIGYGLHALVVLSVQYIHYTTAPRWGQYVPNMHPTPKCSD